MHCRLSTKELAKESGALARVRVVTNKVAKVARMEGNNLWQKGSGKKGGKGQQKGGTGEAQNVLDVWQDRRT